MVKQKVIKKNLTYYDEFCISCHSNFKLIMTDPIILIIVNPLTMRDLQIYVIISWIYYNKFSRMCHNKSIYCINVVNSCHITMTSFYDVIKKLHFL